MGKTGSASIEDDQFLVRVDSRGRIRVKTHGYVYPYKIDELRSAIGWAMERANEIKKMSGRKL